LNTRGGVEADLTVVRLGTDRFMVVTGSGFIANDFAWLRMHCSPADGEVEIRDVTTDFACIPLWGPKARTVLSSVTKDDVSNGAIPYLQSKWIDINGTQVLAVRVSYIGELGWELYIPNERATQVWDMLLAAGKPFGIEPCGYKVADALRLEKGYRYFTGDVTQRENPYEAGLGFCVDMQKGDFIGKDALVKAKAEGLKRKLCTLTLDGDEWLPVYGGEAVYLDGKVVGRVRSGGYGYTTKKNIVYIYLPIDLAKIGNRFQVELFDQKMTAEVTPTVLVDPKGEKLRS
jgi:glycine cleavage system aminomethyltransferase T